MVTYIYFVKCPGCEDEHFDFFDEAKEFALGCMSQKPIITQTEVTRNDFGECVDHCDLGTVWSWEDMMDKETESEDTVFSKNETFGISEDIDDLDDFLIGPQIDEFNDLDNSVNFEINEISDDSRKPIPEGMTIEQLVEEMEENEDTVECTQCNDLFDKSECRKELNLGWCCKRCADDLVARGEGPVFKSDNYWDFLDEDTEAPIDEDLEWHTYRITYTTKANPDKEHTAIFKTWKFDVEYAWRMSRENVPHSTIKRIELLEDYSEPEAVHDLGNEYDGGYPKDAPVIKEAFDPKERLELNYDELTITWDDVDTEYSSDYTYLVDARTVATDIWENFITEEDVADVPGGLETLDDDAEWDKFLDTHFYTLFDKYYDKLLDYYRDAAQEKFEDSYTYDDYLADMEANYADLVTDAEREAKLFDESKKPCREELAEEDELEIAEVSDSHLAPCPECGETSFDIETGICVTCGFN